MSPEKARTILQETRECYQRIATHFAKTREKVWQDGDFIASHVPKYSTVLDVGCGTGRLFPFMNVRECRYTGLDISDAIIKIAKAQYEAQSVQFLHGDILEIPCNDDQFDVVVVLAVLHHIPSEVLRRKALKECRRVLKNDGTLILTVWNLRSALLCTRYGLTKQSFEEPETELDTGDVYVPWYAPDGTQLCNRFVHTFTLEELKFLVIEAGFRIEEIVYINNSAIVGENNGSNIFVAAKK